MSYPKWLYSKDLGGKLIHSEEEEKSLQGEWKDSPAAFESSSDTPVGVTSDYSETSGVMASEEEVSEVLSKSEVTEEKKSKKQRVKG